MGGFIATSHVLAGQHYGVPLAGTLAHSMIMSFEKEEDCQHARILRVGDKEVDLLVEALAYREKLGWNKTILKELYAFVAFGTAYPSKFTSLVDSYDT